MSRNKDIRGFFGKPAASPRPSSSQSKPGPSLQPAPDLQFPDASPRTPPKPTPKPRDRTDEIKGSDDEGYDSDNSLESISAFIERKKGPAPYQRDHNLTTTPKAKRIASTNLKSPLTIQPKPKFDLKYLIDHTRKSNRAEESARRADEFINQGDGDDNDEHNEEHLTKVQNDPVLLEKTAKDLLTGDEEGTKGGKLMRAMHRTKADGSRRLHYFFNLEQPLVKPPRSQFPRKAAKGCWQCLANSRTRDQTVILGLPHTIASKGTALPDELFLWVLDEVCVEKNAQLRMQYCNLVTLCRDSIARLVTDAQLYSMLERLGGPKYPRDRKGTKLQSLPKVENPYLRKDWSGVVTFLELLERMAPDLSTPTVVEAIQLLLRMALDPVVNTTVRGEHVAAMEALVGALAKLGTRKWNETCKTISSYLFDAVDEPVNQVLPIAHMPKASVKALDLRRRMAAVVLFRDPARGSQPVDSTLTVDDITDRLGEADFRVSPSTDFESLRALIMLLDIVIGSAGFLRQQHSISTPTTTDTANADGEAADRKFDADIDGLTYQLKLVHDKIHDSTQLSRKIAKASIDLVAKRLTYAVRIKPPPKTSIFGSEPKEDKNLPKQRGFMKNWAQKKAERNAAALANGNGHVNDGIE
ncbi:phospholipid transporting ATPase [Hypoxylon texense]